MDRILVTGAAGFIGSHTVDCLLDMGVSVVGIDNLRTGSRENLIYASRHANFHFVESSVTDVDALDEVIQASKPDAIIHLAALVSVQDSVRNTALNFELNISATHTLAECARRHGIRKIVFASSAAVYGATAGLPIREDAEKKPISPYGAAKLASEAILLGHSAAFGFSVSLPRYFNVYGPRQNPGSPYSGVIALFLDRLKNRQPLTIYGDGRQTRDFISVKDVARANAFAVTSTHSGPLNICTGNATSISDLATMLSRLFPGISPPIFTAARDGDIRSSVGAPGRADSDLGFRAEISLEQGLKGLVAHSTAVYT
jgi:UDP-glucose 4-epimerase